jgi:pyridoxamine 5'-phosphate oxidase family protein
MASTFTGAENRFLGENTRGRLSTVGSEDIPQVYPVTFVVEAGTGAVNVIGVGLRDSQTYRNVLRDPRVTLTVDDPALPLSGTDDRRIGRGMVVHGLAEEIESRGDAAIRIRAVRVDEWNLDAVGHRCRFVD